MFSLLHAARPVLLNLGEPGALRVEAWADRVEVVDAEHDAEWQLPLVGTVPAPAAVLVRPDGYLAWVGDARQDGLAEALGTWFGPRSALSAGA